MAIPKHLRAQARAEKAYAILAHHEGALGAATEAAFYRAWHGDSDGLREALADGAELGARGMHGRTLLICAVISGNRECVEIILDSGMPLIRARQIGGQAPSALHMAAEDGRADLCALLLDRGAPRLSISAVGKTPLHSATLYSGASPVKDYAACARMLATEREASIEDNNYRTPLLCALEMSAPWSVVEPIAEVSDLVPFLDPNCGRENAYARLCRSDAEAPLRALALRRQEASEIASSASMAGASRPPRI